MLLVQEYLLNKTFGDLENDHGVSISVDKKGYKFSLNYSQINSRNSDLLAQECRGLVLSTHDGNPLYCRLDANGKRHYDKVGPGKTIILAFPMKRFFNYGQESAINIDWNDPGLKILEKLDGSLCILYWDQFSNSWCVSTRSVPEADQLLDNQLFTFRSLFEKAWLDTMGTVLSAYFYYLNKSCTYCFELTSPYNRIVVNYPNSRITLLSIRNNETLQEQSLEEDPLVRIAKVPCALSYQFDSIIQLIDLVSTFNPIDHEGVVIRDSHFNRIKVKNALYVAFNKARDSLATSPRNCLELILAEKDDDVISFLPEEISNNLKRIKLGLISVIKQYDEAYTQVLQQANSILLNDKKTFAITLSSYPKLWRPPFFQRYAGKANNMKDFINLNRKNGTWSDSFLDQLLSLIKLAGNDDSPSESPA